ncbi:MAG: glycosyltransferase family 2 protein [Lachnospiraceae bacterium]|nr:glycosyltransferase family 2 protein [Lachnospiraceae bacterium]
MIEGLVSVVVPVYNAEKWIEDTILSVKSQTYKDWELLLVDDRSVDNSVKVINSFLQDNIRLIRYKEDGTALKNQGAAYARNTGIEEARGQYICFIDADDLWSPDKLEKQLAFMKEKDVAFSFTGYEFADESGVGVQKIVRVPSTINYRQALKNTTIFTSTVMFDMSKLSKEDIKMPDVPSEDTATWWKVLKKTGIACGLDEQLTLYRRGTSTLSSNKMTAIQRIWNLYRNVEKLNIFYSMYCFVFWALRAMIRRM